MRDMLNRSDTLNLLLDSFKIVNIDMLRGRMFHREIVDLRIDSLNIKTCRQFQITKDYQQHPLKNGKRTAYTVKSSTKSAS
jgi:hypothetical protein